MGLFAGLGLPQAAVRFVSLYSATGKFAELRSFIVQSCGLLAVANVLVGALVVLIWSFFIMTGHGTIRWGATRYTVQGSKIAAMVQ